MMFKEKNISAQDREYYNENKENISSNSLVFIEDEEKIITPYKEYQFLPSDIDPDDIVTKDKVLAEWYGTQDEYNELGTYDENTKYYILEN